MSNLEQIQNAQQRLGNKTLYSTTVSKLDGMYPIESAKNVKYFSSIDAEIYFGDLFVDDVTEITFQLQQNTMPLFGYNSYVYDDIALGSRIIQGQFAVNFTKAGYMYEILETLYKSQTTSAKKLLTVPGQNEFTLADLNRYTDNNAADPIANQVRKPLWDCRFNIVMSYGNYGSKNSTSHAANSTLIVLDGVQLTGCSQQLDINGNPVLEVYSFMARDMQFVPQTSTATTSAPVTKEEIKKAKDPIVFTSAEYKENKVDYVYVGSASSRYSPHAEGVLSMQYETTLDITEILVKPELYSNQTHWVDFKAMAINKVNNTAELAVVEGNRSDIKAWHENIYNNDPTKLKVNLQITYKGSDGKTNTMAMATTVHINSDNFYSYL
jgi:hypothetical protein